MAFMIPQYEESEFLEIKNKYGETRWVPEAEFEQDDLDRKAGEYLAGTEHGWFWRLSAPGFLDSTEWVGPFETEAEARKDCSDTHQIDPETGEDVDFDEEPEEGDFIISSNGPVTVSEFGGRSFLAAFAEPVEDPGSDSITAEDLALDFIYRRMEQEQFYPSVWRRDDHGGFTRIKRVEE